VRSNLNVQALKLYELENSMLFTMDQYAMEHASEENLRYYKSRRHFLRVRRLLESRGTLPEDRLKAENQINKVTDQEQGCDHFAVEIQMMSVCIYSYVAPDFALRRQRLTNRRRPTKAKEATKTNEGQGTESYTLRKMWRGHTKWFGTDVCDGQQFYSFRDGFCGVSGISDGAKAASYLNLQCSFDHEGSSLCPGRFCKSSQNVY
jgi:hypothetical protein